jgi:hypothetical protein
MRCIATAALAGTVFVSSAAFAGEGALKPGVPAGVHRAQSRDDAAVLAAGGVVAAFAIALLITSTSGSSAPAAGGGGSTSVSTGTAT